MMENPKNKLRGNLAFQRGFVITDAEFFNEIDGSYNEYPVFVVRHGIRGTQNVDKKIIKRDLGDIVTSGDTSFRAVSLVLITDSAKLDHRANALVVRFSIRFLKFKEALFACFPSSTKGGNKESENSLLQEAAALRISVENFIERSINSTGLDEISCRIARNIANGRWLWRNRLISTEIQVKICNEQKEIGCFEALRISLCEFSDYSEEEQAVGQVIADGLRGRNIAALTVVAHIKFGFGGAIEVFPSQNYIEDKPDTFARSLYRLGEPEKSEPEDGSRIMGRAAIRDQKVSNALRTIDTWYPDFEKHGRPIPVEPNGANLDAQCFFRMDKKEHSAFDMVRRLDQIDPATPEGMFLTACLIRGGVYTGDSQA